MKFDSSKLVLLQRPRYFEGQLLTAQDLRDEQTYQLERQWQHNRLLHGYGVVVGLEVAVQENDKGWQVIVTPGYALDGWGREIVVVEPLSANLPGDRHDLTVYVRYMEAWDDNKPKSAPRPTAAPEAQGADLIFQPTTPERAIAPTTRADFAIPIARLRRPHAAWQRDRDFRPARVR